MAKIKNLVIVESPAKAKTIEKFLGKDFKVMSSRGHVRDLSKKKITIAPDGSFDIDYEVSDDKTEVVNELRKAAKQAQMVWLASDEDREGEAIAWHLYEVLGLKPDNTRRIVFHEITKPAILAAIENPRDIDLNLVDAQQARRVLDRIVGFELSPLLWRKIKTSLSAGRVQSVAVRLIVERENEIKAFTPEAYFRLTGQFTTASGQSLRSALQHRLSTEAEAESLLGKLAHSSFSISDITVTPLKKSPAPPFTTSTLQQEANRKLGLSVATTMSVAQRLYEAGHITYMRTDSLNLSKLALGSIASLITDTMGAEYLKVRQYHTHTMGAQEAHEAIRPTYIDKAEISGSDLERKLYALIRRRTLASQMADAQLEKTTVDIAATDTDALFTATGETVKFDGFLKVYNPGTDDAADAETQLLPTLHTGEKLTPSEIVASQRFTQHPASYTEASLVKKMEELGIGRPSTYAPTISTIQQRQYVTKGDRPGRTENLVTLTLDAKGALHRTDSSATVGAERSKLLPTDIGRVVNEFLTEFFPNVLDYNFTANQEKRFDLVAEGQSQWHDEIGRFYKTFHPEIEHALGVQLEHKVGERLLGQEPGTGKPVSVKIGRFGPVAQIGESSDQEKPRFASLRPDQSVYDITLEEALRLFELPRHLGQFEDTEVSAAVGRFGPYVRHGSLFASIPKDMSPTSITLDEAVELILAKREANARRLVKAFDEDPDLQILNGRYGVFIAYKKQNYKIPDSVTDPTALTLQECMDIIAKQPAKKARTTKKAVPKKTTAKKSTAKKTSK